MNSNIEHIFLHIGLPKTGSSSIQSTLFHKKNQIHLKKAGYLYPSSIERNHSSPLFSAFCDEPENYRLNIKKGFSIDEIRLYNNRNLFFLEREIRNTNSSFLVLSSEEFPNFSCQNIVHFKEYLTSLTNNEVKIDIIVYVRLPLLRAISDIQQTIKNGDTELVAKRIIMQRTKHFFRERIEKFLEIFGKKHLKVYEFEKAIKHPFGLVGHFLSVIGFNEKSIQPYKFITVNQRISQVSADIISYINFKKPIIINNQLNRERYREDCHCLFKIRGKPYDIRRSDKEIIYEYSKEDTFWLKEQFNVDYTKKPFDIEKEDYVYGENICEDIEQAYTKASPVIRQLIYQYFQEEVKDTKMTTPNKKQFLKTLKKIEEKKSSKRLSLIKQLKLVKNYHLIKQSGLFDKSYYLNNNEHSDPIKSNPIFHYLKVGVDQGKDPSKDFNTAFYLQRHLDVRNEKINPLVHYILHGKSERREIRKNFSPLDFLILSDSNSLLNWVFDYMRWHPLIYLDILNTKANISNSDNTITQERIKELLNYKNTNMNPDQIVAGGVLYVEKNAEKVIRKIKAYKPQIKICFIQTASEITGTELLQKSMEHKENLLILLAIKTKATGLSDKNKEEIINRIFAFLAIESWKPI